MRFIHPQQDGNHIDLCLFNNQLILPAYQNLLIGKVANCSFAPFCSVSLLLLFAFLYLFKHKLGINCVVIMYRPIICKFEQSFARNGCYVQIVNCAQV